jgi:peroxiredoxin/DNA-directed RNA polymerase specialized sigma24 family protein
MEERIGEAYAGNKRFTVIGKQLQPGETAPDFDLDYLDLTDISVHRVHLADSAGMVRLFNVVHSLESPVCRKVTRRWDALAADLPADACIYTVSMDLPQMQARWQDNEGVMHQALSAKQSQQFGLEYGVWLKEWHLLQRAVFVIDRNDRIIYVDYVADQMGEPDYAAAMKAVHEALLKSDVARNIATSLEQIQSRAAAIPMDEDLKSMSSSALADLCMREINNYRRGEPCNDQYSLELFRRAMIEHDESVWTLLLERFDEYMMGLFRRHVRRDAASRLDSPENYVARAFERFWLAAVHNQQLQFTTLAAALCYLRSCLNGAIVDTLRSYSRAKEVSLPEPGLLDEPAIEYSEEEGQGLWETIQGMITNEHERRLAYLLFHCNLKPRDIVRLCPQEFSEVREVYRLRRNIFERLLRDAKQIRWKMTGSQTTCA